MAIYTARELITRALYTSNVVARQLETPSGDQITDGLFLLNELLDLKSAQTALIPYWQRTTMTLIPSQEKYELDGVVELDPFTFNMGDVRFPTQNVVSRNAYFGSARVDNIPSLPFSWHTERRHGGLDLYLYFPPQEGYIAQFSAKYALTDVTLDTDMSIAYDGFYMAYLRYALAQYMCQYYTLPFGDDKARKLKEIQHSLLNVSPPDLTMTKYSLCGSRRGSLNWAQANLGRGYYP